MSFEEPPRKAKFDIDPELKKKALEELEENIDRLAEGHTPESALAKLIETAKDILERPKSSGKVEEATQVIIKAGFQNYGFTKETAHSIVKDIIEKLSH